MACSTAVILFDDYAKAAMEYFAATEKLANLAGQPGNFEEAKRQAEQIREKCGAARQALERHWAEHLCREMGSG
jgi:hypothetical protein